MKKLLFSFSLVLVIFSFLFLATYSSFSHAGAAEKWEYDVIPDQSQTLKIKGHKVDQYGAAVNDYDYNTKIDPKTAPNRTKMGNVGFGRLLKMTGWGLLGSAALQGLLQSVDWILDPEAQSIWRYKKNPADSSCTAFYCDLDLKIDVVDSSNNPFYSTQTAEAEVERLTGRKRSDYDYRWQGIYSPAGTLIRLDLSLYIKGTNSTLGKYAYGTPQTKPDKEKEYLTPEDLADYANHTHKDYLDPRLAPKLEPKYSPSIQTDLWKPSNPWEDANSPTVQEVKKKLDEAPPEPKTDPELTPNPETGGMTLPSFCTWAASVCEYFKWAKQEPEIDEPLLPMQELDVKEINKELIQISASNCPADISINFDGLPFGIVINESVAMQPYCDKLEPLKYVFQLITFVLCVMILARI